MTRRPSSPDQAPMLPGIDDVFVVPAPMARYSALDFSLRVKAGMSLAIRESALARPAIVGRMSELLDTAVSVAMLDAYTAGSKPQHDVPLGRFKAFVRVTEARWLWDVVLADDGLVTLDEGEAALARYGALEQQKQQIFQRQALMRRALVDSPVMPRRDGGR